MSPRNTVDADNLSAGLRALVELSEVAAGDKPKAATKKFTHVSIERTADTKIGLPNGMSISTAIEWLDRQQKADEAEVEVNSTIPAFPLDGAHALYEVITNLFGYARLMDTPGFFGPKPPTMYQIETAPGIIKQIPWGRMSFPGLEGFLTTGMNVSDRGVSFVLGGVVKRKHEPLIRALVAQVIEYLKDGSIYKGRSVRVELGWMAGERNFHPQQDAPKFMDVRSIRDEDLIVSPRILHELRTSIFARIERTGELVQWGVPLKHGVILAGPYGVGKTLAAKLTAHKCEENGWTYLYLENVKHLAHGLRLAAQYAPCVVFAEDIDRAVAGETRTESIDTILNTIDGVDTKNAPIVVVLTTNHPESINRAFMRAGRTDMFIKMEAPDAATAQRFIQAYTTFNGKSLLEPGTDLTEVGQTLAGLVPAFIFEAANRAKVATIWREGDDIYGKMSGEDLLLAAQSVREHALMLEDKKDNGPTPADAFVAEVARVVAAKIEGDDNDDED